LFVNETIDIKIKGLQEAKRRKIQQIMNKSNDDVELSIPELLSLFGDVSKEGEDGGNYFITGDSKDEDYAIFEDDAYSQWEKGGTKYFFGKK
jgi:hypothetical protein